MAHLVREFIRERSQMNSRKAVRSKYVYDNAVIAWIGEKVRLLQPNRLKFLNWLEECI